MGEVIDLNRQRAAKGPGCADWRDSGAHFCRCGLFRSSPMCSWSKEQTAVEAMLHLTAVCNMMHLTHETRELVFRAIQQLAPLLPEAPGELFSVDAIICERYREPQHS